jgi:hypothetical protein
VFPLARLLREARRDALRARDVLQSALNYAIASTFAVDGVKLG